MKSAKLVKTITSLLLSAAVIVSSLGLSQIKVSADTVSTANGTVTTFQANLFNYSRDTINQATINLVASAMKAAGYSNPNSYKDDIANRFPAIMFHNGSGNYGSTSAKYGNGNNHRVYSSYYDNQSRCPWNVCTYGTSYNYNNGYAESGSMVMSTLGEDGLPVFRATVADLFNTGDTSDKTVYSDVDVDFIYQDGYYILNSDEHAYTYSSSTNSLTAENNSNGGFWPFGKNDYHFGMDLAVDFMMPEDGIYNDQPCVFEFSGDDDVFIFVDDTLAIDLGGIHEAVSAAIDFQRQEVRYYRTTSNEVVTTKTFEELGLSGVNDNGEHTLRVFYLERGAGKSNCKIKFNMPTINNDILGDVEFVKQDGFTEEGLAGAGFTLYSDEACTNVVANATSSENGVVTFRSIKTGTYYMKETTTPVGYQSNDSVYRVIVAGNSSETLTMSVYNNTTNAMIKNSTVVNNKTVPVLYNTKDGDAVSVNKTAAVVSWDDRTYQINLGATATYQYTEVEYGSEEQENVNQQAADVILVLDNSGSMGFPGDLVEYSGEKVKGQTYYFISNDASAYVYELYYSYAYRGWQYCLADEARDEYRDPYFNTVENYQSYQLFTSPSNGEVTRRDKLVEAAESLIASLSDGSTVGIIQFNERTSTLVELTELTEASRATINSRIEGMSIGGGTRQDNGMSSALRMFNQLNDENNKYVVLVTDGCPDGVSYTNCNNSINGTSGSATQMKNAGATIFTVGLDVNETYMSTAKNLLTNTASINETTNTAYYYPTSGTDLSTVFANISTTISSETVITENYNTVTRVYRGNVVDIVDARFEIPADQVDALVADGASVTVNDDGTTTVTWSNVILANDTDAITENEDGSLTWTGENTSDCRWSRSFLIRAKTNYAGGNSITTNGSSSGVTVITADGNTTFTFPQPRVNVKAKLSAGSTEDTIFLGQNLSQYFTDFQRSLVFNPESLDYQDMTLSYSWENGNGETVTGTIYEFQTYIQALSPEVETTYELTVTATPKVATDSEEAVAAADAMKNDNGVLYQVEDLTATGTYLVKIVDGTITIAKEFDGGYLEGLHYSATEEELIDANQTAIFTVYRYAEGTSADVIENDTDHELAIESYQLTITGDGEQTITGLRAGVYQVVEETSWSWSYALTATTEDYVSVNEDGSDDGIFYIGQEVENNDGTTRNTYVDYADMTVSMTNKLTDAAKKIYADTTNVINRFVSALTGEEE